MLQCLRCVDDDDDDDTVWSHTDDTFGYCGCSVLALTTAKPNVDVERREMLDHAKDDTSDGEIIRKQEYTVKRRNAAAMVVRFIW